jgi:hypothetical protein
MNYLKTYEQWGSGNNRDFDGEYIQSNLDKYKYIGTDEIDLDDIYDDVIEIDKKNIEQYVSLNTIKRMFPIFKKFNFFDDWSIKMYLYQDYFILQKSGYYYTFKKN